MKTAERVAKRIEHVEAEIAIAESSRTAAMENVKKRIADNADDPEYVARWMPSWLADVNYYTSKIKEYRADLHLLNWVME